MYVGTKRPGSVPPKKSACFSIAGGYDGSGRGSSSATSCSSIAAAPSSWYAPNCQPNVWPFCSQPPSSNTILSSVQFWITGYANATTMASAA